MEAFAASLTLWIGVDTAYGTTNMPPLEIRVVALAQLTGDHYGKSRRPADDDSDVDPPR